MLRIGPYELHAIVTGRLRLDGGAMFGVVPKALWAKPAPPDDRNRVQLAMRSLLAIDRSTGRVILIDTGAGDKWDADEIDRFAFEIEGDLLGAGLASFGLDDDDVTDVIVTHLHFDHNGGLTVRGPGGPGPCRPRFRKARHWVHQRQLDHARSPAPKDRASFLEGDFTPVQEAGLFEIVTGDGSVSPLPGVSWFVADGHTPGQLLPRFHDDQVRLHYMGDLIPTTAHLPVPWIMAYDNEPLKTAGEKQRVLQECGEQGLILFFEHDPKVAAARIDLSRTRPEVKATIDL